MLVDDLPKGLEIALRRIREFLLVNTGADKWREGQQDKQGQAGNMEHDFSHGCDGLGK